MQGPVRPVGVVVIGVLTQDQPQVPFTGNQHPVQALAADTGDPAFRDRVRPRRLDRSLDDPHADRIEDRVERRGELRIRSRIRNFRPPAWPSRSISRLRACWVTHAPVGWAVMPAGARGGCHAR